MNRIERKRDKNPFAVPENYFEDFHRKLMQELPGKEMTAKPRRLLTMETIKRWSTAAAITLMFLISATALYQYIDNEGYSTSELTEAERNEYIESILDFYPLDEYNVYSCLTSYEPN